MVQQARGAAQSVSGIAAIKNGSFQMFAGFQFVAKIKGIEAAGYADGIKLIFLDGNPP